MDQDDDLHAGRRAAVQRYRRLAFRYDALDQVVEPLARAWRARHPLHAIESAKIRGAWPELAEMLDRVGAVELPVGPETGDHVYLSTGCRHDEHDYCRSDAGTGGTKIPAQCKFCAAACICPCHSRVAPNETPILLGPHPL